MSEQTGGAGALEIDDGTAGVFVGDEQGDRLVGYVHTNLHPTEQRGDEIWVLRKQLDGKPLQFPLDGGMKIKSIPDHDKLDGFEEEAVLRALRKRFEQDGGSGELRGIRASFTWQDQVPVPELQGDEPDLP